MRRPRARTLRRIDADQLAAVRGGGILLEDPGQTAVLSKSQVMIEELSINFEKLEPAK